jgi:uncharacterized protein YndB with AHSA1/START domain
MKRSRLGAVLLALACAGSWASAAGVDVSLSRAKDKSYDVEGAFLVKAPSSVVWEVLTDYEHIPDFVKTMRRSRVLDGRPDGSALVEQEAVGGAFVFSRAVKVLLQVTRTADRLTFRDVDGEDFASYAGSWETTQTPDGVRVVYRLRARPRFFAPAFLMRSGMDRGARELLAEVRDEIARRAPVLSARR